MPLKLNMSLTKFSISFLKLGPSAASSDSGSGKATLVAAQAPHSGVVCIFPLELRVVALYEGSGTLGQGGVENSLGLPMLAVPGPVQGCVAE